MIPNLLSKLTAFLSTSWLQIALYGLALSSLSILLVQAGGVTNDSWWHLNTGKELWEGTFSFYDPHNWTAPQAYWPAHELGFEWILYGLWMLAGESFVLMGLLNVLLIFGALFLLLPPKNLRDKFNLNWNALIPLLIFGAGWTLIGFIQIRAQGISFFLFALVIRLILMKKPQWLPLVFLAWVWLHGSVFVGIALAGVATLIIIGRWLLDRKNKEKLKDAIVFSVAGILSLVATCLSPLGFGIWAYFIQAMSYGDTEIHEWQPLFSDPLLFAYGIIGTIALAISIWKLWRWKTSWEIIFLVAMSLFFLYYAFSSLRYYGNFILMILPLVTAAAMTLPVPKKSSQNQESEKTKKAIAWGIAGLLVIVSGYFTVTVNNQILANGSHDPFASGNVAEVLRSDQCTGALWNDYDTGSYMLWFLKDIPVSVDSRFDLYPRWVTDAAGVTLPPGGSEDPTKILNSVFEEHDIRCLVMNRSDDTKALTERGLIILAENLDMVVFEIPLTGIPEKTANE